MGVGWVGEWSICVRRKKARPLRADRRNWRDVLREYHAGAGRHVGVTLPRLQTLEKEEEEESERAA